MSAYAYWLYFILFVQQEFYKIFASVFSSEVLLFLLYANLYGSWIIVFFKIFYTVY